jgi:hypothetical protein
VSSELLRNLVPTPSIVDFDLLKTSAGVKDLLKALGTEGGELNSLGASVTLWDLGRQSHPVAPEAYLESFVVGWPTGSHRQRAPAQDDKAS